MKSKHFKLLLLLLALGVCNIRAAVTRLTVKMDRTSPTMTLVEKNSSEPIATGTPSSMIYEFDVDPGDYLLTGYATDNKTVTGTIEFKIKGDSLRQQITVLTNTLAVTNKNSDGSTWAYGEDYTITPEVYSREGVKQTVTLGNSLTAGRKTCLAYNGNTIIATFSPSDTHRAEGYTDQTQSRTLTAGVTISTKIPLGGYYTITAPKEAGLELNMKVVHFADFKKVAPVEVKKEGENTLYTYYLSQGQVYNYRTWMEGKLTQGGYFTYPTDASKMPLINFTMADYEAFDPKQVNHSTQSNSTYETGDIFVNADYRGMLSLEVGESFKAHAMRTWELTDNSTNNYFIEPDFHYTVLGLDGRPCDDILDIDTSNSTSPWATITGKRQGTAIVLVSYDAIALNYYRGAEKKPYLGGPNWGAIWPENTAVYVVTVGEPASAVVPNMTINEKYNFPEGQDKLLKVAGKYVDAEHDVFYYLDTEDGAHYTFTPEGVDNISIAYPTITDTEATYTGFTADGVVKNEDGSFTLTLRHGRQIVKMTDAQGRSTYQVLRARRCSREIVNVSRPGSKIFQPGDQIKVQYDGLFHPANKIAGIYNMSAYVTYNGVPNGTALILGANQYNFAGTPKAQAVEVVIPDDFDIEANPVWTMNEGVIQVNGFGDPIGNHRFIDPVGGRSPNFTAIAHKTYFGHIPEVSIALSPYKVFDIRFNNPEDAALSVTFNGKEMTPGENGLYCGTYGTYSVVAKKKGYICYRRDFAIADDAEGTQIFDIELTADAASWDGVSTEPATLVGDVYHIANGAQLAWFADGINGKELAATSKAVLDDDIQLGSYDWKVIGSSSTIPFSGEFDGNGHTIRGLFVNEPATQYRGLFGYLKGSAANKVKVSNLSVEGYVCGKAYTGGLAGSAADYTVIDRYSGNVKVVCQGNNAGGVLGYLSGANSMVTNSCNLADVSGTSNAGGIVGGMATNQATASTYENIFNAGEITGGTTGGCLGSTGADKANVSNAFTTFEGRNTLNQTTVTGLQMASGEVAWMLGEAFGQTIGSDILPVIGGEKVYRLDYVVASGSYGRSLSPGDEGTMYTNTVLPELFEGEKVKWFADAELTQPVKSVSDDTSLYAVLNNSTTGVDRIDSEDEPARWFTIEGVEVAAPEAGSHGLYIRVAGGKATKVVK